MIEPFELGYGAEDDSGYCRVSDEEIATAVGVPLKDLDTWLAGNPEFTKELRRGQKARDLKNLLVVEEAAYDSARGGMEMKLVKGKDGRMSREEVYIPPSAKAQELLLERLNPDRWKDKEIVPERLVPPTVLVQINNTLAKNGERLIEVHAAQAPIAAPDR